jgi:TetR/AcrR family transcriptional regulator
LFDNDQGVAYFPIMPQATFFNLLPERRAEILEVCFEEFALNDYRNASVSHIVRKLQLAKGSFYRYFEHKMDLYAYLIDQATGMRMENVRELLADPEQDFFELLVENFRARIQFDLAHPLISGFLYNVMQERNEEELGNMLLHTKFQIVQWVKPILTAQQERGKIRRDLDLDLLAYAVVQMQMGIYDYLAMTFQIDFRENIRNRQPVLSVPEDTLARVVSHFSEILRSGLTHSLSFSI